MKLRAYGCPECPAWHRTVRGVLVPGAGLQVRCSDCGNVETITGCGVPTVEEVTTCA